VKEVCRVSHAQEKRVNRGAQPYEAFVDETMGKLGGGGGKKKKGSKGKFSKGRLNLGDAAKGGRVLSLTNSARKGDCPPTEGREREGEKPRTRVCEGDEGGDLGGVFPPRGGRKRFEKNRGTENTWEREGKEVISRNREK